METDSIEIYIYDSNSQMLVSTKGSGPKLTTTPGSINVQSLIADNSEVNSVTNLTFTLQPLH